MKNKKLYNPSDNGRRKYVSSMRNRILAGVVAAVTAASPVLTSAAELGGYLTTSETDSGSTESLDINTGEEAAAETVVDNSGTVSITTEAENTESSTESVNDLVTKAEKSEKTGEETETKFLFINLAKAKGGTVILNEGEMDNAGKSVEKRIKLVTQTDTDELGNETTKTLIHVYDKDDVLIDSEDASESASIYVCEVKTDEVVTVKVVADDGYVISRYDLQDRLVDGVKTDVGFDKKDNEDLTVDGTAADDSASEKTEFSYPVFMKDNMALTIELEKKQEKEDVKTDETTTAGDKEDLTVDDTVKNNEEKNPESVEKDLTVGDEKQKEDVNAEEDTSQATEAIDNKDSENGTENINADDETSDVGTDGAEDVNDDSSSGNENIVDDNETVFPDATETVENLNQSDFSSARLIIMTYDDNNIVDKEHMIGNYDNIYLMQYKSVEQAMNAYAYYETHAEAVEPDKMIEVAEDINSEDTSSPDTTPEDVMTENNNPIAALSETSTEEVVANESKVIALIDTGAHEGKNIIGRVSLIDDVLTGGEHADDMVDAIVSQNEDAKIFSIRTIGNDGSGSISAVVAGIEYAINQNVDIINLSLYANKTLATTVLENEIQKAIDAGISVVGAAGNDGADASNYIPGSMNDAWILGAADDNGNRRAISNYGDTVDYYAKAKYTSNAAAMFSGYISKYGIDAVTNSDLFLKQVGDPGSISEEDTKSDDSTILDPVIENYIKKHIDTTYTNVSKMSIVNVMRIKNTMADGTAISDDATIDSIMSNADISPYIIGQTEGLIPVYQMDEDSDYFVAYVDTMKDDKNAELIDVMVAQNDTKGVTYEGWHVDKDTGLLYMPKSIFYNDGQYYVDRIQVQALQKLNDFNWQENFNSTVGAVTSNDTVTNSTWTAGNIYANYTRVQVGQYLDVNNMLVAVNGLPMSGDIYGYEPETGLLTIGFSPSVIQSVHVDAQKREGMEDIEPGVKLASGHTFDEMLTINDVIGCAPIGVAKGKLKVGYGEAMTADFCYPEGYAPNPNWSYQAGHAHAVQCYNFTWITADSIERDICYWILYNVNDIDNANHTGILKDGLVWDATTSDIIPFVLNLSTFDASFAEFDGMQDRNGSDVELALKCCHIDMAGEQWDQNLGSALGKWQQGMIMMRILNVDTTKKKLVCGIYTQRIVGQHGFGLFAVNYKEDDVKKVRLAKRAGVSWSKQYSSEIYSLGNAQYRLYKEDASGTEQSVYYMNASNNVVTKKVKLKEVRRDANNNDIRGIWKTNSKGNTGFIYLPTGTYYFQEYKASQGYSRNQRFAEFKIKDSDTSITLSQNTSTAMSYTLSEQPKGGRLLIKKTNRAGESTKELNLEAVFKVEYWDSYSANGTTKPKTTWYMKSLWSETDSTWLARIDDEHVIDWVNPADNKTYKSGGMHYIYKSGKFMKPDGLDPMPLLPLGSYRVTEVQAPAGCKLPDDPVVKLDPNDKTKDIYVLKAGSSDLKNGWLNVDVANDKAGSTIQIKKTDNDGNWDVSLKGAEFTLYEKGSVTALKTITINDNKYHAFDYLCTVGKTYVVRETKTPAGKRTAADIEIEIKDGNDYQETYKRDVKNAPLPSRIKVKKTDKDGNWQAALSGVKFGLFEKGSDTQLASVTITSSDYYEFEYDCAQGKTYTIKETYTPECFETAADQDVTIEKDDKYKETYSVDVKNEWKSSTVEVTKRDGNDKWDDRLKGTQFTLYEGDTQKETITINNNGAHAFTTKLWPGKTYTIKETSTAAGFVSADDITWSISETKYQAKFSYTVKNNEGPKVKIIKKVTEGNDNELLKLSGYSLQNATFEIYTDAACKNKIGTTGTDEKGVTPEFTLPCKDAGDYTYYIKETVAPKGHKLNTTVVPVKVSLPKDNGVTKEVEFTDEPETADNLPDAMVQKLSSKGKPVEGVVFEVKLYDGTYGTAADCPADKLKKTWYLKSDNEGKIIFDSRHLARDYHASDSFYKDGNDNIIIPLGCTLTMQEKQTPSSYVLDDTIMIWKTDSTQKIDVKKFYNQVAPCKITVRKLSDSGQPLRGVEFELKFVKESEAYTDVAAKSYTPLLKQGETTKATTDANGYIVWQNLDQGEYQITETKTVSGNTLLKDPINITLPITMTDKEAKAMSAATDQGQFDEYTNKWYFYEATFEVTNSAKFIMPTTGANGVWRFIFFGFGTMAILVTGLVVYDTKNKRTRKRKRK